MLLANEFQTLKIRQVKKIFSYVKITTLFFTFIHITPYANIRPNITTHIEVIVKIYKHQTNKVLYKKIKSLCTLLHSNNSKPHIFSLSLQYLIFKSWMHLVKLR